MSRRRNFASISSGSWYISISGLEAAILDFPLPVLLDSSPSSAFDMPNPKNVRVDADILCLATIEAKIHWFMSTIHWNIAISGFAAAILYYWKVMDWSRLCYFVAQSYLGKVTKAHLLTPSCYKMASKKLAWGVKLPPMVPIRVKKTCYSM